MYIGVVGGGFVGSATALLECETIRVAVYDLDPARCKPSGTTMEDLKACDLVFVCVPTPTYASGACNTTIVEKCVASLKAAGITNIVLRSTVPPGTSDRLGVMFMPEFLTEANWRTDFYNCRQWVFGVRSPFEADLFRGLMRSALWGKSVASEECLFVTPSEAELIKYTRNNFLALKISFCNEIYRLCTAIGAEYEAVRKGFVGDPRIGASHTGVPGFDGHYGFGGTCLPKDTSALCEFMKSQDVDCPIVSAMVHRNRNIDRPEHDWESDPRAFTATAATAAAATKQE